MTIELSDDQFEILLRRVAENGIAFETGLRDLRLEIGQKLDDIKIGLGLAHTALGVLEEDLVKVQAAQREHAASVGAIQETLAEHTQALVGVTELSSTNFDLIESLNKHIHGESSTIGHASTAPSRGTRPPQ